MNDSIKGGAALLMATLAMTSLSPPEAHAGAVLDAPSAWQARFSTLKGDVSCAYGDPDCNRCANDVRASFASMGTARLKKYEFGVSSSYAPVDWTPRDFLSLTALGGHLQSFVRLPLDVSSGDDAWFAATYSSPDASDGAVYFVRAPVDASGGPVTGTGHMEYVHRGWGAHPGGAQGFGQYLVVGRDNQGSLDVYNAAQMESGAPPATMNLPNGTAAAGAAKLAGGGTLFISKRWGQNDTYDFFYANGLPGFAGWQRLPSAEGTRVVENVSVITECGTGDIYVMGGTGDESLYATGSNYWTLYALSMQGGAPRLDHVQTHSTQQSAACDGRASATAFVTADGELSYYCSQKVGTEFRDETKECVDFSPCEGSVWKCGINIATGGLYEAVESGHACVDALMLDHQMQFKEIR